MGGTSDKGYSGATFVFVQAHQQARGAHPLPARHAHGEADTLMVPEALSKHLWGRARPPAAQLSTLVTIRPR